MGATGDSIDAGDTAEPDEHHLPGGTVASGGQDAAKTAARRIRGQLTDLAEEAEQQARDEFERAVLDALAPSPPLAERARLAAFAAAQELAGHPWVSLPVPCEGGIAFLLGASSDDEGGALVSPPLADAYVDGASLSVTVDRLAATDGDAPPSIPLPATAARALPGARVTAYWLELVVLDGHAVDPKRRRIEGLGNQGARFNDPQRVLLLHRAVDLRIGRIAGGSSLEPGLNRIEISVVRRPHDELLPILLAGLAHLLPVVVHNRQRSDAGDP